MAKLNGSSAVPSRSRIVRWTIYGAGLIPALWTYYNAVNDRLGADPVKALEHALGLWSLRFLILGLAITPLRAWGGPNLTTGRRAIGLLAFAYATLHLLVYIVLDRNLELSAVVGDILKRPYITVGMLAFLVLVPLAITSSNSMVRTLGAHTWRALHRWVYFAATLAVLHFVMLVKTWSPEPVLYAALLSVLLLWRAWDRWIGRPRRRTTR